MKLTSVTLIFFLIAPLTLFASMKADPAARLKVDKPEFSEKDSPVICFDEAHANLSTSDGRYLPVLNLLKSDGFTISHINAPFTETMLKGCRILYVSAPQTEERKTFSSDEIELVKAWVKNGGSLLLASDHPGMAQAAEPLANAFNVYGSLGTTEDPNHTIPELKEPANIVFEKADLKSRSPILSGFHPEDKISKVVAFVGQSLSVRKGQENILPLSDSATDRFKNKPLVSAKGRSMMLAFNDEKGRVVILGDATVFTSKIEVETSERLGINRPGTDNYKLALNTFRWLAGMNRH